MKQHESFFSYTVSRPLPFRWFTPVAIVGGILFAALFTFLNFASSSYELIVENSLNPNETISNHSIPFPSFMGKKARPICQPTELPIGSQFFTNQTALKYTLASVWQDNGGSQVNSPSLTYQNQILDCTIDSIDMDIASLGRSMKQMSFSEWGIIVRSHATCSIQAQSGTVFFNLTQTYDYIPDTVGLASVYQFLGTDFLSRDQTRKASLWWGESLMSAYYGAVTRQTELIRRSQTDNGDDAITRGSITLSQYNNVSNIQDGGFFYVDWHFMKDRGRGDYENVCCIRDVSTPQSLAELDQEPNIWNEVDYLAKAVYSTVLTDLGQMDDAYPNILTDEALLTFFSAHLGNIEMINFDSGPATDSYEVLKDETGPLGLTPSVISTSYICQVPKLKSVGNIIFAILVADLVLMQAVWLIYKLVTEMILNKTVPDAHSCQGCKGELSQVLQTESDGGEGHPYVKLQELRRE